MFSVTLSGHGAGCYLGYRDLVGELRLGEGSELTGELCSEGLLAVLKRQERATAATVRRQVKATAVKFEDRRVNYSEVTGKGDVYTHSHTHM